MSKVFVTVPSYGNQIAWGAARSVWLHCTRQHRFDVMQSGSSLITMNCNLLWVAALNLRATKELEWFAMLHTDVEPEPYWLDTLIAEAERHNADLMSAVIPLKNDTGSTSTAIADPGSRFGMFCRLTQAQVRHASFPDTFDIESAAAALERLPPGLQVESVPRSALLTNTGCFVCRLTRPWAEQVWFEQSDRIELRNGSWTALMQPEDWNFARRVADNGGKVMATRLVNVIHHGATGYHSEHIWGQPTDLAGSPRDVDQLADDLAQRFGK